MTASSKRPEQVAWASLFLSLVFFVIAFFLGRWSGFFAVSAVAWQILAAALIWLVLAIQFHQRSLAEQEKLDMSQLAQEKETSTIIGVYLTAALRGRTEVETQQPLVAAIATTAIAFLAFLLSRYATGMSAELRWKPLRAGGSYLLGVALVCFALALSLAGVHFHFQVPVTVRAGRGLSQRRGRHRLSIRLPGLADLVLQAPGKGHCAADPLLCRDALSGQLHSRRRPP